MNILIISRGYPDERDPVNGNFESDQAKSLVNLGHNVVVLCVDRRSSFRNRRKLGITKKEIDGLLLYRIYYLPLPLKRYFLKYSLKILSFLGVVLFKFILKDGFYPHIIHAHYLFNISIALKIKKQYNIPVVATEHWSLINSSLPRKDIIHFANDFYPKVDKLISVSKHLNAAIYNMTGCDSVIIPNIVDTSCFSYEKKDLKSDTFSFVSVGSLIKSKGFDILIHSFSDAKFGKEVQLYIVGGGPYYTRLRKLIEELDLQDQVYLLGKKSRLDIGKIFNKSNVFVLPSRSETFGVVYIEALASGLPVIATACGGPESFITKEDGIIIPVGDRKKLTYSLEYIKSNIDKFNPKLISERCISRFSPKVIGEAINEIYYSVIVNN